MATQAHCAFCFESLAASFERRQPLDLHQAEDLWEQYQVARGNVSKSGSTADSQEDEDKDEDSDDAGMTDAENELPASPESSGTARPAAISRLLNRDTSSADSSSSSLPSTRSASSSGKESGNSSAGNSTPASSSTSLRSRLSFGRRKETATRREEAFPLFVTWNTVSRSGRSDGEHNKILRGCIGTFDAQELEYGLRSYALTSAFEDHRFSPIPASQLPRLSVHVTLLTDFAPPISDPLAWTIGTHGLRIAFTHRGRRLGATYLPEVAREQGWTKEETLASLMRKAGWSGSDWRKVWRDGNGELVTYEGKQAGLLYDEWKAWRDWVETKGVQSRRLN